MQKQQKILIVEDDPVTNSLLSAYFEKAGYWVAGAGNGREMWDLLSQDEVDLILLDINLPGEDGLFLTKSLRVKFELDICIILVTALKEDIDRIVGLELGADDYVTKPFNERELLVRVRNLLNRASNTQKEEVVLDYAFHGWTINMEQRRLTSPTGEQAHLTNGEFLLLSTFTRHPGRVFNRGQLLEAVSSREWMPNDRTIDVMVNRLRRKLETNPKDPKILVTVHGVGYQFVLDT
jgi:two-component system, OmpR family, torCAD operon response regulator TorR